MIVAGALSLADNKARLVEVSLDTKKEQLVPTDPWLNVTALSWLSDGTGLVLTGRDVETKLFQLWFVSYPDGKTRRITNDLSSYAGVSLTADGKTLASVQSARSTSLWLAPNGDADAATKITFETGKDEGLSGLTWTADGQIVHTERSSGATDLWMIDKTGRTNTQLTRNAGRNFYPSVTPDGRFIVFISDRNGRNDLWRIDIDGRNPLQLTNFAAITTSPSISLDGNWVFYQATVDNLSTIWKTSINGGDPIQLTHTNSLNPHVAPTGDVFVCQYGSASPGSTPKIATIPVSGGEPVKMFDFPAVIKSGVMQWDSKGEGLIYRDTKNRVDNLWLQPLNGGAPKELTDFTGDQIFGFAWSRDGKNLVVARGRNGSDVVMITSFR